MENGVNACGVCGLILPEGTSHGLEKDCIADLQRAMFRQKEAAENLGLDLSVRFLELLKGLCENEKQFETILERYKSSGDWSPMYQLRVKLGDSELQVMQLMWLVEQLLARKENGGPVAVPELEELAMGGLEALRQLGIRPLDPRLQR